MYRIFFKRLIDVLASLLGLLVISPILLVLVVLVRTKLGAPVFFKQERPGKDEKIFTMYKFRTMTSKTDENGVLLPDKERMTKFGSFLRKTSLDELPELFNVLKGDMSLVGPRPLMVKYLDRYNNFQKRRHEVRPGITGLAQVNGRNSITWNQKFNFDVKYVDNITFIGDVKILFRTVFSVFNRKGITSENSVTAEEFKGEGNE